MPPKRRTQPKQQDISLADAFLNLSASISKQAREPNILAYKPHTKQQAFHESEDYLRAYIGGNRSGKTFGAVCEDIYWASGTHPFQKLPFTPPVRGRVVAVDLMQGVNQIILPLFGRLLAPSMLINGSWEDSFNKGERMLTFANGSTIEFMSYEMETEKFAGTSRHFIHLDEEPPKHIFNECAARVVDTNGRIWISMTPLDGITWVHEEIYEPVNEAVDKHMIIQGNALIGPVYRSDLHETTIVEVGMNENPHLSEKARERFLKTLGEDERKARSRGEFVQVSGKIFPNFTDATHVVESVPNPKVAFKGWAIYTSTDHGWNNPTAWLWHAVSPTGRVVTFGEHYEDKMTIEEHAAAVKAKELSWGITVDYRTGDPAMRQTSAVSATSIIEEYAKHDLFIAVEGIPRPVEIGIAKMQQYFRVPATWTITRDCPNFIRELKKLRYKSFASKRMREENNKQEQVHKKDDHAFDSARYFATSLPDLSPETIIKPSTQQVEATKTYQEYLVQATEASEEKNMGWQTIETYS